MEGYLFDHGQGICNLTEKLPLLWDEAFVTSHWEILL